MDRFGQILIPSLLNYVSTIPGTNDTYLSHVICNNDTPYCVELHTQISEEPQTY